MNCKNCGAEYLPGDRFCPNCGQNIDRPPESQPMADSAVKLHSSPVLILEEQKLRHSKKRERASAVFLFALVVVLLAAALAAGYFAFFAARSPYEKIKIPDQATNGLVRFTGKQEASYDAFIRSILKEHAPGYLAQYDLHPRSIYADVSKSTDGESVYVQIVAEWADFNNGAYLVVLSKSFHKPNGEWLRFKSVEWIDQTNNPVSIPLRA